MGLNPWTCYCAPIGWGEGVAGMFALVEVLWKRHFLVSEFVWEPCMASLCCSLVRLSLGHAHVLANTQRMRWVFGLPSNLFALRACGAMLPVAHPAQLHTCLAALWQRHGHPPLGGWVCRQRRQLQGWHGGLCGRRGAASLHQPAAAR